jgi:hypothetical protein
LKNKINIIRNLVALVLASFSFFAIAHQDHHKTHHPSTPLSADTKMSLEKLNEQYLKDIKPIFQAKCFDCHSSQSRLPWYQKVPGAKQLIENDIAEAKEHLNMETDFPFKSHAAPIEDLNAIDESISKSDMPPLRYRFLHPQNALSTEEKEKVHRWVELGNELLKEK